MNLKAGLAGEGMGGRDEEARPRELCRAIEKVDIIYLIRRYVLVAQLAQLHGGSIALLERD
jgi:hypothetical protein